MSFRFYKFCQNGLITIVTSLLASFVMGDTLFGFKWLGSLIVSIIATTVCFLPGISIFYPLLIGVYLVLACIGSFSSIKFYICLILLITHIIRMFSMLSFAIKNPALSNEYDKAIRFGYKL